MANTPIARSASETAFKRYATKQQRQSWTCTACGHHLHPTAGTIFHRSSTSLRLWFHAMYLMTSTRCGISAKQLERELGVHYKTAWRMFNKIRNELMADGEPAPASGEVEVDETSWGGKPRRKLKTRSEAAAVPGSQADGPGDGRARRARPPARDRLAAWRAVKSSRAGECQPGIDPLTDDWWPTDRSRASTPTTG